MPKIKSKKLVLTGPPGAGKTTIKKVYFELANPIRLLDSTLEPTRGVSSSVFSLFKDNLGVFDLAGQENALWFSKDKQIFNESSVIICIFDIRNTLKTIVGFIVNILKIISEFQLHDCKITIFLHKIDLVKKSYLLNKLRVLKQFIEHKLPEATSIVVYQTSIAKEYFLKTYYIILDILNLIYTQDLIPISKELFNTLKMDLTIILYFEDSIIYSWNIIKEKFKLSFAQALLHLERLSDLGLIELKNLNPFTFKLTERARIFKLGFEKETVKVDESRKNKGVDLFYTFLNLKKSQSYT